MQLAQIPTRKNRGDGGMAWPSQRSRTGATFDAGNLDSGEGAYLVTGMATEKHVEVVKISFRNIEGDGFPWLLHNASMLPVYFKKT